MKIYNFTRDPEKKGEDAISLEHAPKRKLDLIPRLICLLVAAFIWLYMVNLNDTDVASTVTLKVEIIGEDVLHQEENMMIYGVDVKSVTATIKGSNRDLRKYTEADYRAVVDVSNLRDAGRHTLPIQIITPTGSSIAVTNLDVQNVNLYSDEKVIKSVLFQVVSGYMATAPTYTYEIVQSAYYVDITGPRSAVDNIESAQYQVEGEYYSSKSFSGFTPMFCDKNGDYISFEDGVVSCSTSQLTVSVNVRSQKSIPVVVKVSGMGKDLVAKPDRSLVTISGDPIVVAQVSEYVVNLSEAVLGRDLEVTLSSDGLPEGVTVVGEGESIAIYFELPAE